MAIGGTPLVEIHTDNTENLNQNKIILKKGGQYDWNL